MLPVRDEQLISSSKSVALPSVAWFYLSAEFLIGAALSGILALLAIIRTALPKPPRELSGDVVLVTGAATPLGRAVALEFARHGCSMVCVDTDLNRVKETTSSIVSRCSNVEDISPEHRRQDVSVAERKVYAYQCNLWDRHDILRLAKKTLDEVGRIDVLVTCVGHPGEDILDTVSTTLMSHYWTVLAFLPSMLRNEKAHVVGITPANSSADAFRGSRAAVVGLMESLGHELSDRNSHVTFITIAPKIEPRQNDEEVAKSIIDAVRRDQRSIDPSWTRSRVR
ncbi:short-chain dehydrogenase/reductase family 16C member 6-like [Orussus abietinus]|uniref:short-chain dehydrogenase/reductase family 16C member 6-like n=1 Tax=Orussus abietinus TaxID=222816 RepID=UPI000625F1A8|nr:short-chain dehydrogenase/reductase family 16C member 6-like [Orussus abietinus]